VNPPRLIVGLGNPSPRHARNRHNIGFRVVEAIATSQGLKLNCTERKARVAHGLIEGQRVILAQPQTWMNESGQAVGSLARFYRTSPTDILVIYDDLDIPLGTVRYRASGSSGGHRGVQSIIQHLGTDTFPRLRIGIGRPPGRMDPAAYVLQNFSPDEEIIVNEVVRLAADTALAWLRDEPDLQRTGMTWRLSTPV